MIENSGHITNFSLPNDAGLNELKPNGWTKTHQLQHRPLTDAISVAHGESDTNNAVTIALIDCRTLTRDSFSHMLITCADDLRILPYATQADFLADQPDHYRGLGIIILSIGSGTLAENCICDQVRIMEQVVPDIPIVVLCDLVEVGSIVEAYRHGIRGYIPTNLTPSVVIGALRLIKAGGTFMPANALVKALEGRSHLPDILDYGDESSILGRFTPRQRDVLDLLRLGKSNKAIAYDLDVEESTVKVHVRQIMRKLKVTNRTHAALMAQQMCKTRTSIE
ncbi:MAG: response regulator transcription factor [Pseudomonadota bacterium]|nr:response regulator transcription factor [Pseudomonadota bacterium]